MGYIVNPVTGGGAFVPLAGTAPTAPLTGSIKPNNLVSVIKNQNVDEQFNLFEYNASNPGQSSRMIINNNTIWLNGNNKGSFQLNTNGAQLTTLNQIIISSSQQTNISSSRIGITLKGGANTDGELYYFDGLQGIVPVFKWGRINNPAVPALSFFGSPLQNKQTIPNVPNGNVSHTDFNNLLQVLRNYGLIN